MSDEQAVRGTQAPVSAAPPPSMGSSQGPDFNIMLLLAMLEKGTLDTNGKLQKYFAKQQKDGAWEVNLMKAIAQAASASGGVTSSKDAEAIIDRYMKVDMSHLDANQIIALCGLRSLTVSLKNVNEAISQYTKQVAQDQSDYSNAVSTVQWDKGQIQNCIDHLKSWKDIFPPYDYYWATKLAYYKGKELLDEPKIGKAAAKLSADQGALKAAEIERQVVFSQGTSSSQNKGQRMEAFGKFIAGQLENANKNIMTFSSAFFVPQQQV